MLMKENHNASSQYVKKNRVTVFETTWLFQYLSSLFHREQNKALYRLFWPNCRNRQHRHTNETTKTN